MLKKIAALTAALALATATLTACGSDKESDTDALELIQPGTLKVGATSDNKPYSYNENGKFTGFEVEMAEAIAEEAGLKIEFTQKEFAALIPGVASGQTDAVAASTSITDERKAIVDFTSVYYIGYISILAKKDNGVTDELSSMEGKKLGLMQGSMQDKYAQDRLKSTEIVRYPDYNAAVAALKAGSIDGVFIDLPPGGEYVKQDDSLHMPINIELPEYPVAMPIGKDKPNLKKALDDAIDRVIKSGKWLEIDKKYYPNSPVNKKFLPEGVTEDPSPAATS
ncbi:ABC transporter substrate-binding protein [Brevibacterium sp. 50QC2O2]|uniref:ABC transporter substrate-binding protein n=1 Tax=Brevibacterium sp. 50QC2O2 TaxID=2968459 RepID=UPI00211BD41D|nr:ABC transporter substrate-binding protein [Brevibacterium sp. 50QC2O2]MCQ9389813.1 ABC transporter substrate-binding protein [Brevibacterium sp. 50QC2O2]